MTYHTLQQCPCPQMIFSCLRTPVRMRKSKYAVCSAVAEFRSVSFNDLLRLRIDAPYQRYYPQLIPDPDLAERTFVNFDFYAFPLLLRCNLGFIIFVFRFAVKIGTHIIRVNVFALRDVAFCRTYNFAVLYYLLSCFYGS